MSMNPILLNLKLPDNEKISIDYYAPNFHKENPILLILHGFKGFKNWGFFPYISRHLCELGYATFTINFSLNGVTDDIGDVFDVDKFANNTLSRELYETETIIHWLINDQIKKLEIQWNNKLFLLGHSRGGGISALTNSMNEYVSASVHWASVGKFGRTTPRQNERWKEMGKLEIPNSRTGQMLYQNYTYFEDLLENKEKLSIINAVKKTTKPMLFIHGSEDLVIRPQEVSLLPELNPQKIVHYKEINQTGHTFSVQHPMNAIPEALTIALNMTSSFFEDPYHCIE